MAVIEKDRVVKMHYTLKNDEGKTLDSSQDSAPLEYLHGQNGIIPGLEQALAGKQAGDQVQVRVEPALAYGERIPELVQAVDIKAFSGVDKVEPGMVFQVQSEQGQPQQLVVEKIEGDQVTVDGNHMLAGQALNFDVEIVEVRSATEEELAHGHAHGEGGHAH